MHRSMMAVAVFFAAAGVALAGCGAGNGLAGQPVGSALSGSREALPTDLVQPAAASCSFPANKRKQLYVANENAHDIIRFKLPNKTAALINSLGTVDSHVTFDHKLNMWVSEFSLNVIREFAPPYTGSPIFTTTTALNSPRGIAFDGKNNLYIADYGSGHIIVLAPPYTGSPKLTIKVSSPLAVALDASCNLWVASSGIGAALQFAPPYTLPAQHAVSLAGVASVALDATGNLFLGSSGGQPDKVVEVAPPYTGSPIATITKGVSGANGIEVDARGNIFVSNYYASTITKYARPYTAPPSLTLTNQLFNPGSVRFGP